MIVAISSVTAAAGAITAPSLNQPAQILQARGTKPKKKPTGRKPVETPPQTTEPSPDSNPTPNNILTEIEVKSETGELAADLRDRLLKTVSAKIGQPISQSQIDQDVQAIRSIGSFQSVRIQTEQTAKGTKLTFIVKAFGTLRQVSVKTLPGNTPSVIPTAEINKLFSSLYGQPLNTASLAEPVKKLNELYKEKGYELAQVVNAESLTTDGKLVLIVAEGVIEDIQVRFMNAERRPIDDQGQPVKGQTRDFIITREVALRPGQIYNRKTIDGDLRRIYSLGQFEDLGLAFVPGKKDPNQVILQINVLENRKTSSFNFGGTIGSSSGPVGNVGYKQLNLGGNNQTLGGNLAIGDRTSFDLSFNDPWIAGDPNRTGYEVSVFQRRNLPLIFEGGPKPIFLPNSQETPRIERTGGGIAFSRPLNGNPYDDGGWRTSLGVNYQKVTVQDFSGKTAPIDGANQPLSFSKSGQDDLLAAQVGLYKDTRDSRLQPSQGSLMRFNADQSVPIGDSKISLTKLSGNYTQYIPINLLNFDKGPQSLSFNIQGGTNLGDLPPYEAFPLGGVSSVRGYEEGGLAAGRSYVRLSTEYQFPIVSILGGSIFADYGTDLGTGSSVPGNPAGSRGKPGSGFGYGAALRVNSPFGPLQLNYGLNDRGETRIQFGLNLSQ
jgi:outer membrane protein insertion porin family